ncbi:MAG: hypothetical protein QNJ68_20705 [Microcoleaceae cyanobacterium MO_207.B10]|nr:hypothetical protein [Microcoleaceae cyanobacterium MO_207.B10]
MEGNGNFQPFGQGNSFGFGRPRRQQFFNNFNQIQGTEGDDDLIGTAENDGIFGDAGNDILTGEAGNDIINGGDGSDILTGGPGIDRLRGGEGEDTFVFNSGSEIDVIGNFIVGEDIIQLSSDLGLTAEQAVSQATTIELPFMDNRFLSILNQGDDTLIIRHEGELTSDSFQIL